MADYHIRIVMTALLLLNTVRGQTTENTRGGLRSTYTRTELKVARNLNMDSVQTLNVLTRDGSIAQLIVKKRDKKSDDSQSKFNRKPDATDWERLNDNHYYLNNLDANLAKNNLKMKIRPIMRLPKPVTLFSENVRIHDSTMTSTRTPPSSVRTPRPKPKPVYYDTDGIPVVEGIRVPDDDTDRETIWRNARVINGQLYSKKANIGPFTLYNNQKVFNDLNIPHKKTSNRALNMPVAAAASASAPDPIDQLVRQPVYQYSHPEYGLQNVPIVSETERPSRTSQKRHDTLEIAKSDREPASLWLQFTDHLKTSLHDFIPEAFKKVSENFAFLRNLQRQLSQPSPATSSPPPPPLNKFYYDVNS